MKKFGFTLSEVIIALGIIGVLAAITMPLTSGIVPDKSKIVVLKAHKALSEINETLLNDPGLYMTDGNCQGLNCTEQPYKPPYNTADYQGADKYPLLLAAHMELPISDDGEEEEVDINTIRTKDGIVWTVNDDFTVIIDIDHNGNNCSYNAQNCTNPDQFRFRIDPANGKVFGNDPLTRAYLANRYKMNDRKNDLKTASEMN